MMAKFFLMQRLLCVIAVLVALIWSPPGALAGSDCKRSDVTRILRDFFPAYNDGRSAALDELFSRGQRFRSYDVRPIERTGEQASKRKTLIPYFQDRHDMNDKVELSRRTLRVGKYDNGNRGFGFSLELDRTSNQLSPFASGHFIVKGSVDCDGIYFWNMTWDGP